MPTKNTKASVSTTATAKANKTTKSAVKEPAKKAPVKKSNATKAASKAKVVAKKETSPKATPAKIKKTDIIAEILNKREDAADILMSFGFHCVYCPSAQMETLEQACEVHEIDVNKLLKALNN